MLQLSQLFIIILAGGYLSGRLFSKIKLPSILGMVLFGIACSFFLSSHTPAVLWEVTPFLKSFALIVILLRAGLGLKKSTLKKVGKTAIAMSFIPCLFEGISLTFLFHVFFGFSYEVAGLTAFMLAAVSPAVVVPSMLDIQSKISERQQVVPTIILAGASVDDVFAITLFSVFLGLARSSSVNILKSVLSIPLSIAIGITAGIGIGLLLTVLFKKQYTNIRATEKTLILLVCGSFLVQVGDTFHFAALLGLMTIGFILLEKFEPAAHELSLKLSKIWIFAEITLFVIIGYSVDITTVSQAGLKSALVIVIGLVFRSLGVLVATSFSGLNWKQRLFCMIAYIPKATVQAALGGVALGYGIAEGEQILAIAVVSILLTAPLGLFGIRFFGPRLLQDQGEPAK
jgi:NhaP-type Na+/H+ or K+/H+ antiporter